MLSERAERLEGVTPELRELLLLCTVLFDFAGVLVLLLPERASVPRAGRLLVAAGRLDFGDGVTDELLSEEVLPEVLLRAGSVLVFAGLVRSFARDVLWLARSGAACREDCTLLSLYPRELLLLLAGVATRAGRVFQCVV